MGMRSDCRHYFVRTLPNGERQEGCAINAAPEAPLRCPVDCPYFEKRGLSKAGFVYGSLVPKGVEPQESQTSTDPDDESALEELRSLMDDIGPQVVSEEAARADRQQPRHKRRWRKRKN